MAQKTPVVIEEHEQISLRLKHTNFVNLTLSLNKYISYYDDTTNKLVVLDIEEPFDPIKVPCEGYRCIVNPLGGMIGVMNKDLKTLTIFDLDTNMSVKTQKLKEDLSFWKWISETTIAIVTKKFVYHWNVFDASSAPVCMFGRHASLEGRWKNINYVVDATCKWLLLTATGQQKALQLYSVERGVTQMIDGYRAVFCRLQVEGNLEYTNLLCYVVEEGTATKLVIMEVGASRLNRPFAKKVTTVELTEDDEGDMDTVIGLQASFRYGLVFLVTLYGYIHLFDIETGQCIFSGTICANKLTEPGEYFFDCAGCEEDNGVIAVNMKGQLISITVTDKNLKPYIRDMKRNVQLVQTLEKRCNRAPSRHAGNGAQRNGVSDQEEEEEEAFFLDPRGRPSAEELDEGGIAAQMWNFMMRDQYANDGNLNPAPSQSNKNKKKKKKAQGGASAYPTVSEIEDKLSSASVGSCANAQDSQKEKNGHCEPGDIPPPREPSPSKSVNSNQVNQPVPPATPSATSTTAVPAASGKDSNDKPAAAAAAGGDDDIAESKECTICFEREFDTLLVPCGHYCLCFECATEIKRTDQPCPVCRGKVENVYKVYVK